MWSGGLEPLCCAGKERLRMYFGKAEGGQERPRITASPLVWRTASALPNWQRVWSASDGLPSAVEAQGYALLRRRKKKRR